MKSKKPKPRRGSHEQKQVLGHGAWVMGFIDNINAFKVRLEKNAALNAFAAETFGKAFTVQKEFRNRVEINMNELPVHLITRPILRRDEANQSARKEHTVQIYSGFYMLDKSLALAAFIELDELIENAVVAYTGLSGDKPMAVRVVDSINDEGTYHPSYFMTMQLLVKTKEGR